VYRKNILMNYFKLNFQIKLYYSLQMKNKIAFNDYLNIFVKYNFLSDWTINIPEQNFNYGFHPKINLHLKFLKFIDKIIFPLMI
jgi:hypothetical protein